MKNGTFHDDTVTSGVDAALSGDLAGLPSELFECGEYMGSHIDRHCEFNGHGITFVDNA